MACVNMSSCPPPVGVQVVVLADQPLQEQTRIANACHDIGVYVVCADARGVLGCVFCDFGDAFVVEDVSGEPPIVRMVAGVSSAECGVVAVVDTQRHSFSSGDLVRFTEVEGMPGLNDSAPREVKVTGPYSFTIGDTRGLGKAGSGGWVHEVKQAKVFRFKRFSEALEHPEFVMTDWCKDAAVQHACMLAIKQHRQAHGRYPRPGHHADADDVFKRFSSLFKGDATPHAQVVRRLARASSGKLCPMAAALGGLAAQEVIKACSSKFTPITQWLYYDAREVLGPELDALPASAFSPASSR